VRQLTCPAIDPALRSLATSAPSLCLSPETMLQVKHSQELCSASAAGRLSFEGDPRLVLRSCESENISLRMTQRGQTGHRARAAEATLKPC
jgi:hypothetical protein